ncbi:Stk1 family PASTA domain-containing Ser/Thr kinase [Streptomyces sp. HUAS MG47]|uniref:Stk1 family PASTA domain-containing Ser/Thr kinase n=1 Tax=Streptomyces solicamelliae TaxID=3231716 RepID=UPI003877FD88
MDTTLRDPLVGQQLDGRYRIDARIAVGGMATVYRALDTRLDRVLALKVMHPELAADATFVERFIREAKSAARLDHPNVVGVFDQGADGAYVYLAMEYVAGCTLRDVLRERGALQPRAALDVLEPVLAALGAAHRAGFVHRDMKPENVLIGDDGRVKVADFGLVRAIGSTTNTTGTVLGTVSYLAPEQIEHGTADTRADVYACGVVLYEMLTGGKPHTGDTPAQVLYRHLNTDVPAPSAAVPGLALELDELVASATARNPDVRPYDAVALLAHARRSRAALSDTQLDLVPPQAHATAEEPADDTQTTVIPRPHATSRLATPPLAPAAPEPTPAQPPAPRPVPGAALLRRGPLVVVLAVLLLLGVGSGVWYINSGQFTRVPSVLGRTEAEATKRLDEAGLEVAATERAFSDAYARGTVMATDPSPGDRIRGNGSVRLTISRGPEIVRVPNVKGKPLAEAKKLLARDGLVPGVISRAFSDDVPQGAVIRTSPEPGTERRPDSAVALVVSRGVPVDVPGVTGDAVADATTALKDAGLKVQVAPEQVHSPQAAGTVAAQSLAEGSRAAQGDTIVLTVSKGPRMVAVPDVTGKELDAARALLEGAGFQVKAEREFPFLGKTVKSQSPTGTAPEGSTITLKIKGI